MKRVYNKDNRLESHRIFPYIAWAVVFGFAFFVYHLVKDVEARITALESQNKQMEYSIMEGDASVQSGG